MIYIDPPYNTGRDFIYKDRRIADRDTYSADSGQIDEDGNRLVENKESNGRFHSDWLSFIYPRLKLARNLLRNDGVIFISIDDNEQANLKKLCDEIFGAENFLGCIVRKTKMGNRGHYFAPSHDYVLAYTRDILSLPNFKDLEKSQSEDYIAQFKYEDSNGKYNLNNLFRDSLDIRPNQRYFVKCPDGSFAIPPGDVFPETIEDAAQVIPQTDKDKVWLWSRDRYLECDKTQLVFKKTAKSPLLDENGNQSQWSVSYRYYLADRQEKGICPRTLILDKDNALASRSLEDLDISFSFPKPHELVEFLGQICGTKDSDIILDFFAGSGTTAQAVMQLNAEDGGRRKFILVQLDETIDEKSEAAKDFANIAEICKERIRRAGRMIKTGKYPDGRAVKDWQKPKNPDLDIGFRIFKIDSSNMREDYYRLPQETAQADLPNMADNIKPGRSAEDLLFRLLPKCRLQLSSRIEKRLIENKDVYIVRSPQNTDAAAPADLSACFDRNLTESLIKAVAELRPACAAFLDCGFRSDSLRENAVSLFKQISKSTVLRVI